MRFSTADSKLATLIVYGRHLPRIENHLNSTDDNNKANKHGSNRCHSSSTNSGNIQNLIIVKQNLVHSQTTKTQHLVVEEMKGEEYY